MLKEDATGKMGVGQLVQAAGDGLIRQARSDGSGCRIRLRRASRAALLGQAAERAVGLSCTAPVARHCLLFGNRVGCSP